MAGRTAPNRAVRFGGEHNRLDERGRRDVAALAIPATMRATVSCGPEVSVRQTSALLGLTENATTRLRSLDIGRWYGAAPDDVDPGELREWLTDPDSCPHGGETIRTFVTRVRDAAGLIDASLLVVASPVAQALLCDSVETFFAYPVVPGTIVGLS